MNPFPYLDRQTAEQAEFPADERMAHVLADRFCNYPAADLVLDKLKILFYDDADWPSSAPRVWASRTS